MDNIYFYDGQKCVRALDFLRDGVSDSAAIEAVIHSAKADHIETVLIDGKNWTIDRAIEVPSDTTMIVDGVKIKLADEVLDNILRPDGMVIDPDDPYGFPIEIRKTENIRILGRNGAVLEGPDKPKTMYHTMLQEMQEAVGCFWGWRGYAVYWGRCSGFELSGLTIQKTCGFAFFAERSKKGYLHDLRIFTDCKNGDGIHLSKGCSEIRIENITAKTADDCIALQTYGNHVPGDYPVEIRYLYPLNPGNYLIPEGEPVEDLHIHDISIRNITTSTDHYSQGVSFLPRHGYKIYNVKIENIIDGNPVTRKPRHLDMVGVYYDESYGGKRAREDLAGIEIDHVVSNSAGDAILLRDYVEDLQIRDVIQNCPDRPALTCLRQPMKAEGIFAVSGKHIVSSEGWLFDASNYESPFPEWWNHLVKRVHELGYEL